MLDFVELELEEADLLEALSLLFLSPEAVASFLGVSEAELVLAVELEPLESLT